MKFYLARREQYAIAILLVAIIGALVVLSYAYGHRALTHVKEPPVYIPAQHHSAPSTDADPTQPSDEIMVHVAGAVHKPGVYALQTGARINDAVMQAGGARDDGYPDALNLAEKLSDGVKIYVPTKAEWESIHAKEGCPPLVVASSTPKDTTAESTVAVNQATDPASTSTSSSNKSDVPQQREAKQLPTGKINLNTATKEQLMTLPGVGEVTAQHIIEYRTQHGKFTDLAQLLDVPRIGAKTLEKLTPYLTL